MEQENDSNMPEMSNVRLEYLASMILCGE